MKVLIIGGAGMVGRKLAERLAKDGALAGKAISKLTLYDVVPGVVPEGAAGSNIESLSKLNCTINPREVRQKAGGGAQCSFETGK